MSVKPKVNSKNNTITKIKDSFSREEMEKAFDAGIALLENDWHMNEFHTASCNCTPLKYNTFDEWIEQNFK